MNAHPEISQDKILNEIAGIVGAANIIVDDFAMQPYLVEEREPPEKPRTPCGG